MLYAQGPAAGFGAVRLCPHSEGVPQRHVQSQWCDMREPENGWQPLMMSMAREADDRRRLAGMGAGFASPPLGGYTVGNPGGQIMTRSVSGLGCFGCVLLFSSA